MYLLKNHWLIIFGSYAPLKKAAKHYGIVSQMGNQGHTTNGIRLVKEWYEAGVLGEVREVIAWQGKIDFEKDSYFAKPNTFPPQAETSTQLGWIGICGRALLQNVRLIIFMPPEHGEVFMISVMEN